MLTGISVLNADEPTLEIAVEDPKDCPEFGSIDLAVVGGAGIVATSAIITLSANEEPIDITTETAQRNDQDNTDDDNGNMTLGFGFFIRGPQACQ